MTPLYWQGYVGASTGLVPAQQQSVLYQPPLTMLQNQNQLQHSEDQARKSMQMFSELTAPLTFPSTSTSSQFSFSNSTDVALSLSSTASFNSCLTSSVPSHLPSISSFSSYNQEFNVTMNPVSSKAEPSPSSVLPILSLPYSSSSTTGPTSCPITTLPLLTPGQLLKSGPTEPSSLQKSCSDREDIGALLPSSSSSNLPCLVSTLPQAPLLPLPLLSQQGQHGVTQFTEEYDFIAMNEKFNKDEVCGSLGKAKQSITAGDGYDLIHGNVEVAVGCDQDPKSRSKPVYNRDDFFDTLDCNSVSRGGRTKFSERMKLDTETFGEFENGPPLGHVRFRGSLYNRPG